MDLKNILIELKEKRDGLDRAILALEHMAAATIVKRRGRPPKWLTEARADAPAAPAAPAKRRGRPPKNPR